MSIIQAATHAKTMGQQCFTSMLSLFLNRGCSLCDRPALHAFCVDCNRRLQDNYLLPAAWTSTDDTAWPISALGPYENSLKQALRALKYNHRPDIATTLGHTFGQQWPTLSDQLTPSISATATSSLYVIPIPLHANRRRQRGYNQAELIAKAFCQASGLLLLPHGLIRTEDTLPQHQLGLSSRQKNLENAFAPGRTLTRLRKSAGVLLIDDIYTTGATMQSATEALASAGIRVVGVLAIARAVSD